MDHVFISHSRKDRGKALIVRGVLSNADIPTYMDNLMLPGVEWRGELREALDDAFAVIVICTKASMRSSEVCHEWSYALGQRTPVIPLKYQADVPLHTRLQEIQHLDFTDPVLDKLPWNRLIDVLEKSKSRFRLTIPLLMRTGLNAILTSRDELNLYHPISSVLGKLRPGSTLTIVARSCEAWARQYEDLQDVINSKSVHIRMAIVDPRIPKEQWLIQSDWAQFDVGSITGKLGMITIAPDSKGSLTLYFLPNSPLFSFVNFTNVDGDEVVILEAGADLPLRDRSVFIFKASDSIASDTRRNFLYRLCSIYNGVFEDGRRVLVLRAQTSGASAIKGVAE